jgi:hypothetical protein
MLNVRFLIYLIVFFLPYTNSLVLNIGFPLRIYELLIVFLLSSLLLNVLMGKKNVLEIHIAKIIPRSVKFRCLPILLWYNLKFTLSLLKERIMYA